MPLSAGDRLGRYEVIAPLGAGGMGEVYRAHEERLERDVAIKVLPEEVAEDPDRLARFEREARAAAALNHPNIMAVHELGEHEGRPFIVTELLEGESLRSVIDAGGLTSRSAVAYAVQIANGLAVAHDKGMAHRDLKPENLFLTRDGTVKILDFGLAKLRPERAFRTETPTETLRTSPGTLVGTVAYMAPEQLRGEPADHRSDVFALGVVLYEMLCGRRPFVGGTTAETAAAILKEDAEPLASTVSSAPPALASIVARCLEKRPEDRFSSAHDLALALRATDDTTSAAPPPRKAGPRRRWPHLLAMVIAAAIALLVVLPPEGLWQRLAGPDEERPPIRSIALLPLDNLTGDPEQAYFVDGLHEELISTFAQISAFDKVIARTSVMAFRDTDTPIREIGERLDVEAVLEGSVRQSGDTVRATLQLIDARTESHLWAGSFERDLNDILALQSEVARAVASEVRLALTPEETRRFAESRTVSPDAYRAYLRGIRLSPWYTTEEDLDVAVGLFERAIELDPGYAPAYVGLSRALLQLAHFFLPPTDIMPRAYAVAQKGVELDDNLADAHARLGAIKLWWQWDWSGAETEFRRALELSPNNTLASVRLAELLTVFDHSEEATSVMRKAFELDPLSWEAHLNLVWMCYFTGRYDSGIEHGLSTLEIFPSNAMVHIVLSNNYVGAGEYVQAVTTLERAAELLPPLRDNALYLSVLGWTYRAAGRLADARSVGKQVVEMRHLRYVPPTSLAAAYYAIGDNERMYEALEVALEMRDTQLFPYVMSGFPRATLGGDPRFQSLVRRMDLPPR
jgi:serine/threonine protein kinase/tetratricopeptide (TPR) repeat protein